ncbi:MAG: Xaa-Pro peptidase family protein [Chitinivibrionia bacterium]|nr:Xaa-Pro peptidase family protein [Chitinivibrionia bacterium]
MSNRFEKANELLEKHKSDYLLITDDVTARYFSGFSSSNVVLLYNSKEKFLFTDFRYKTKAEIFCQKNAWNFIETKQGDFAKKISKIIKRKSKLLVQDNILSVYDFELYKKNVKNNAKFINCGKEIDEIFYVKTDDEINSMKKAAEIGDLSIKEWQKKLREGISEFEAARLLDIITLQNGSEKTAFDTIVLFGENSAFPHGVPSRNRKLKKNDVILSDFGATVDGFCSDMTRMTHFGASKKKYKEIYDIVLQAQLIGVENVKAGTKAKDIDKKVRDFISQKGFADNFGHATGHSVGLRIHEKPSLGKKDDTVLQSGMVITVEPGIYLPNAFGIRIEDMTVVTENGCEIITKTTKNLIEI